MFGAYPCTLHEDRGGHPEQVGLWDSRAGVAALSARDPVGWVVERLAFCRPPFRLHFSQDLHVAGVCASALPAVAPDGACTEHPSVLASECAKIDPRTPLHNSWKISDPGGEIPSRWYLSWYSRLVAGC